MIAREHNLIFVHIQKTGGNSICKALGQIPNCPEKHFLAHELRAYYGPDLWNDCFRFSFVRNPWSRLVSWYSMIDGSRARFKAGAPFNKFQTYILENASTFAEFLKNCDREIEDSDGRKWIFRNQIEYLVDPSANLLVDYIGRFEDLQRDFDAVCIKALGQTRPLPHSNRSSHASYVQYYTPELTALVAERFQRDIQFFGYRFGE